jgi:hypothetical protein
MRPLYYPTGGPTSLTFPRLLLRRSKISADLPSLSLKSILKLRKLEDRIEPETRCHREAINGQNSLAPREAMRLPSSTTQ